MALLNEATTADLLPLEIGAHERTLLFNGEGRLLSEVVVGRTGENEALVLVPRDCGEAVKAWLSGLADGYVLFDGEDLFRKVQGPALVEEIAAVDLPATAREWLDLSFSAARNDQEIQRIYEKERHLFAPSKAYFVGQNLLSLSQPDTTRSLFSFEEKEGALRRTPLHAEHAALGAKLVPFAGWEMPVWYTSALEEHRAVRERAGLFDLGHMGVFEVAGEGATAFLDVVTANYAAWLEDGQSQYSYLLDTDGDAIDDIFLYRRGRDRYLLVVNAANAEKDWAWLTGVNEGQVPHRPRDPRPPAWPKVVLRDLKRGRRPDGRRPAGAQRAHRSSRGSSGSASGSPSPPSSEPSSAKLKRRATPYRRPHRVHRRGERLRDLRPRRGRRLALAVAPQGGQAARPSPLRARLARLDPHRGRPPALRPRARRTARCEPVRGRVRAVREAPQGLLRRPQAQRRGLHRPDARDRPLRRGRARRAADPRRCVGDRPQRRLPRASHKRRQPGRDPGRPRPPREARGPLRERRSPSSTRRTEGRDGESRASTLSAGDRVAVPIPATIVSRFMSRETVPEPGAE